MSASVLDLCMQLWCTWCGVHWPTPGHSHRHPDALPTRPGEPLPLPTPTAPTPSPPQPSPAQARSLLIPQGRLLTLLDDSSLHLWEIVHHHGCAHLEEALSFQPPSRPGFDSARYWRT